MESGTPEGAAGADPPDGPRQLGRYAVRGVLGAGCFGIVYEGFDEQLQRRVAIKVPTVVPEPSLIETFLQEARRLARLNHPGIVSVLDVGFERGRCYLVSQFVPGPDLRSWLAQRRPTWQQAAIITARVADALAHAHAQGVIHRDVKPANIILAESLKPVLLDLGLALEQRSGDEPAQLSGTPLYMSPEQARGGGRHVDARTDIYSLGVVLYEMVCGRRPFEAEGMSEVLRLVRDAAPVSPRTLNADLPEPLERICLRALSKRPADRFGTAGDLATALRELLRRQANIDLPASDVRPETEVAASGREAVCPRCRQPLPGALAACPHCATRPERSPAPPARTVSQRGPSGRVWRQRRHVAVLACQLRIAAGLEDEQQGELVHAFDQLCQDVATSHGGLLLESKGPTQPPTKLICFGFPRSAENNAEQAVRGGIHLLREMAQLTSHEPHLAPAAECAAAVTSGTAVGGTANQDPRTAARIGGRPPAEARRLVAGIAADALWISPSTARLVAHAFRCWPVDGGSESEDTLGEVVRPAGRDGAPAAGRDGAPAAGRDGALGPAGFRIVPWGDTLPVPSLDFAVPAQPAPHPVGHTFRSAEQDPYSAEQGPYSEEHGRQSLQQTAPTRGEDSELAEHASAGIDLLPPVGQRAERRLLRALWDRTCRGQGQVITLVGEPGVGKTRLARELSETARRESPGCVVLTVACSPSCRRRTLYPVTDLLTRILQLQPEDPSERKLDKLLTQLREQQVANPRTVALLAALLSIPLGDRFPSLVLSAEQQKRETLEVLVEWLEAMAGRQPVLLVVDAVQLADSSTHAWLNWIAGRVRERRLMILLTARSADVCQWQPPGGGTRLVMGRLNRSETAELAGRWLGEPVSADSPCRATRLSGGVPLFVRELALERDSQQLSGRLRDLLQARLDEAFDVPSESTTPQGPTSSGVAGSEPFPAETRETPQPASDGRTLLEWAALLAGPLQAGPLQADRLAALSERPRSDVRRQLERLVEAEILETEGPLAPPTFRFRAPLMPQVVQEAIPGARRRAMQARLEQA